MSIFPTKILVATDGSEEAEMAATTVINLAKSTDSELHILTVAPGYPAYDVRVPEVAEELRRQAQTILDEQLKKIEQAGGEVAQAHLRLAVMGSVSDAVVRNAHCPVMVVRGEPVSFPTKILLATDGSREAELATTSAADLAKSSGSELHIVA